MPFSTYLPERIGTAVIEPAGEFEAGSYVSLTLTYTAGHFGIDDTGALKFSWRTASDAGKPQFHDPGGANYTTVEASNGARLAVDCNRNNIRPWVNTLFIRVERGFLRAGDQIMVRLGDRREDSPGIRLQTACEDEFFFKTFVDAFSTYDFVELPESPKIRLVPGPPARWKAILPTLRRIGEPFRLAIVAEDRWGNPSDRAEAGLVLDPDHPVDGLPERVEFRRGAGPKTIEGLTVREPGDLRITLRDATGEPLATSNPLRIAADAPLLHFWGDLHGQSNETVGTNSAADYFAFARDRAFVDIIGHQANDFQIDDAFWAEINRLAREYDAPGRFVALPGYEWSGNTGMGGDRNVFFATEGRPIRRSSSVLLDPTTAASDVYTAAELFAALDGEDAVVIAHVGGRYADLNVAHDGRLERAVEVHSCWGTFEWLLHDAFRLGHRVGVVCHSDDHKGRPGAAYPGASTFGAIGGLTCYLMPRLDRPTLFETLRRRHCYGTTGARLYLDVRARFAGGAERFDDDPAIGPTSSARIEAAIMGDILRTGDREVRLEIEALGSAPIERLVLFNGARPIETVRGYAEAELGARIRVLWEGAEYRGRDRDVHWRGRAMLAGNRFVRAAPVNFFNVDRPLRTEGDALLEFASVTTGNYAGFDLWLAEPRAGELRFASNIIEFALPIAEIGYEDRGFEAGGLGRQVRLFRLPDENGTRAIKLARSIPLAAGVDNPLYVRLTQEDGHQAWSSPIYVIA